MQNIEKLDSKNLVRICEKCNLPSLLLSQEVMGKASFNIILKSDLGVVAERWSCQHCDHYFEVTIEKTFFNSQLKIEFINPLRNHRHRLFGDIFMKNGLIAFELIHLPTKYEFLLNIRITKFITLGI